MKFKGILLLIGGVILVVVNCQIKTRSGDSTALVSPIARLEPKILEKHGQTRVDNYYWLRERENPEVIAYLEAENDYTERMTTHTRGLEDSLFEEIKGRIKQDDSSVPYLKDGYYYYMRFEPGKEYALHCRKKGSLDAPEQMMLDANRLAEGHEFFSLGSRAVNSGTNLLAFATDTVGRRIYTIGFKALDTGEILAEEIPEVSGNMAWAEDNRTLFYTRQDLETLRCYQVWRHTLGADPAGDVLVYEEKDETFSCYVFKTKSKKYLMIGCDQTLSSEFRCLAADNPAGEFRIIQPRETDHEYQVDHFAGHFYIRTNWEAQNFRLMKTPVESTPKNNWEEVLPHREDVLLEDIEIFRDYLVAEERRNGLIELRVIPWDGGEEHYLQFEEPAYVAYLGTNPEIDTGTLRYGYSSLTTPNSVYDYDLAGRERKLMKREEVLGEFDPAAYRTERLYTPARDSVKVPVSLVYRKDTPLDGSSPLLLYGYGSYGISSDPSFSTARLSLLDRGFVYAIAHVRGGEDLGRQWYEDGKLLKKKNTFTDFIDCAEFLLGKKYTSSDRLFATGRSAGGLLMGAVLNMRPELFKGVIAGVPFVDVVTTMLDDDIPLTTSEYDEWGNPNDKEFYDYILGYSPYDNVTAQDYPNILVFTGLHDSQVQYWEPAKWVAKLRALKTDHNRLVFKINMEAGHGGASGRFKTYRETAFQYAFLIALAGK
ncbi:MAG TPA: S9 family peptidase [Candidatus Glassbacteria bacterium]|nr:S9 family peptidase [Candidatus Glassbacteria bacterium]